MTNEIANIRRLFDSYQISLSNIWLETCVAWCKEDNLGPNYTLKELQAKVYEQWLLLDLRDVEVPALPPNLSQKKHFCLEGNVCLQMMQVMDISKPKLWQLNRIRNTAMTTRTIQRDFEIVGEGKRVLQLTLTDGVQTVEAIEFHPISCLNLNLTPGIKIRLIGPITVRRGRLLLEAHNVKILKGEVEDLIVVNAAENVLARALNLPLNPNPQPIKESLLVVEREETNEGYRQGNVSVQIKKFQVQQTTSQKRTFQEMQDDEEIELLLEAEQELNKERRVDKPKSDPFEDDDFNPDVLNQLDEIISSNEVNIKNSNENRNQNWSTVSKVVPNFHDFEEDIFENMDFEDDFEQIPVIQPKVTLPQPRIMPISKLLEIIPNVTNGVFKIRAKFLSVVEKLTILPKEYNLVIKLEDDSGEITVRVHSDIISDFTGYCPEAVLSLQQSVLSNDKNATQKVLQVLRSLKNKLILLDNIMGINVRKEERFPILKEIL